MKQEQNLASRADRGLVLDEWHVFAEVGRGCDDDLADEVRQQITMSLKQWAEAWPLSSERACEASLRLEVDQ